MALTAEQQAIAEKYLPLVQTRAQKFAGAGISMEDAIGYGALGLCRAAKRYDPNRNFANIAIRAIDAAIIDALRRNCGRGNHRLMYSYLSENHEIPTEDLGFREVLEGSLGEAVGDLPKVSGVVLRLRYWHGRSFAQIGQALGLEASKVSKIHAEALGKLREIPSLSAGM